jgi:prepilin-type processing-associated H-X9-DG protein
MRNYKELMLIIVISGAMLGLGMKTAKFGTTQWKKIKCQSNLKAIYELAVKYQNDHNGNTVTVVDKTKRRWRWWYNDLLPYTDNPYVFYCPANQKAELIFREGEKDPLRPKTFGAEAVGYGMNGTLSSISKNRTIKVNIKDVKNPAYVVYFGDSKTPSLRGTKWCWKSDYAPRHENKSNFVFMDGSVKLMDHKTLGLCQKWKNWEKDRKRWKDWDSK